MSKKTKNKPKYLTIKYKRTNIRILKEAIPSYNRKPEICPATGLKAKPRAMQLHHWTYAHSTKAVRENKELVFDNGVYLSYIPHTRFANHWSQLIINTKRFPEIAMKVYNMIPLDLRQTLDFYYKDLMSER